MSSSFPQAEYTQECTVCTAIKYRKEDKNVKKRTFYYLTRAFKNPYGNGDAAIKTIDAIEKAYNEGLLNIESPENIMSSFSRKMIKINEDISVGEFEEHENALVHMVFDGEKMIFPLNDLNLKGMMITYDVYQ